MPRRATILRARRPRPEHRDRGHRRLHVRLLRRRVARPGPGPVRRHLDAVGDPVRDDQRDLPAGGAAALAHDRGCDGRGAFTSTSCAGRRRSSSRSRRRSSSRRWRCTARCATRRSTDPTRSTGCWSARRWPTRARTSRAAISPGTSGSGSTAGWCCSSRCRASASRSRSRSASRAGRPRSRWASWRRRSPRCSSSRGRSAATPAAASGEGATRESAGFAVAVAAIQLAEQTLVTIAVLLVPDAALRGIVFNALLIARAPLQLFQAIQTSLLPHLAGVEATEGAEGDSAIRFTITAIAAFAGLCALGLLAIGPVRHGRRVRQGLRVRARRPGGGRGRHGLPPHGGHAQPVRARKRPRGRRPRARG